MAKDIFLQLKIYQIWKDLGMNQVQKLTIGFTPTHALIIHRITFDQPFKDMCCDRYNYVNFQYFTNIKYPVTL